MDVENVNNSSEVQAQKPGHLAKRRPGTQVLWWKGDRKQPPKPAVFYHFSWVETFSGQSLRRNFWHLGAASVGSNSN